MTQRFFNSKFKGKTLRFLVHSEQELSDDELFEHIEAIVKHRNDPEIITLTLWEAVEPKPEDIIASDGLTNPPHEVK